jgi:hypothetical protein
VYPGRKLADLVTAPIRCIGQPSGGYVHFQMFTMTFSRRRFAYPPTPERPLTASRGGSLS